MKKFDFTKKMINSISLKKWYSNIYSWDKWKNINIFAFKNWKFAWFKLKNEYKSHQHLDYFYTVEIPFLFRDPCHSVINRFVSVLELDVPYPTNFSSANLIALLRLMAVLKCFEDLLLKMLVKNEKLPFKNV